MRTWGWRIIRTYTLTDVLIATLLMVVYGVRRVPWLEEVDGKVIQLEINRLNDIVWMFYGDMINGGGPGMRSGNAMID